MSPSVELSAHTFARLQQHAIPLVDDIETVINRLTDYYESKHGSLTPVTVSVPAFPPAEASPTLSGRTPTPIRQFSSVTPPDLTHTKVLSIELDGKVLDHNQTKWNTLLYHAVREAKNRTKSASELSRILTVATCVGEKTDEGYRFFADIGMSVQGQDANSAWRGACSIFQKLGCPVSVTFAWRQKEGAAFPGVSGRFVIP